MIVAAKARLHRNDRAEPGSRVSRPGVVSTPHATRGAPAELVMRRAMLDPAGLSRHDLLQLQRTVGNRAVAQLLATVVQRRIAAQEDVPDEAIRDAAQHGLQTPAGGLPFADQIQKSFGRHDVSHVRAHQGETATASAQAMNALAYTTGDHVVFGGRPSLHTAAHESAHVVQQRGGAQVAGGIGRSGDRYEQHADAVADRVTAGQSAEDLLDQVAGEHPAPSAPVQRLIGFEFETRCELLPGETESKPQKDEKLVIGDRWHLASEVVPGKENRVAEFKTTALNDQTDPAEIAAIMDKVEQAVFGIARAPLGMDMGSLGKWFGTAQEAHQKTKVVRSAPIITAKPQVTGGISAGRILDLLAAMGSGTKASRKDLMGGAEPKEEGGERPIEQIIAATVWHVREKLKDEPAEYQSFIGLLVVYIAQAQTFEVSKYFKAIIPALSRMNLGRFMKLRVVADRKDRVQTDISAILPELNMSGPMFPLGVYDSNQKAVMPAAKPTVEEWITDILNGADTVPWSVNVNQAGGAFGTERVGPKGRKRGVPIELRTLKGGVPFYDWKPLAVHFFRYIQDLNDLSKDPPVFRSILQGMSDEERLEYERAVEFYREMLVKE
jgi:Domain of unknown function (DUF4157)